MSSVSGSGGSSNSSGTDESVRKLREEYRKKEAELIKKHQKELQAIDRKYSETISNQDKTREADLREIREKSSQSLSRRDQRYQKEVEDLRKMHTAQLERLMIDNNQKMETTKNSARGEIKQANLGKDDRTKELDAKYDAAISQAEENYNKSVERIREDQKKSLEQVREGQKEAHSKEMEGFRDYHSKTVAGLKNDLRQTRYSTQQRIRNQEVQHMNDKMRMNNQFISDVQAREEAHNQQLENYSDDYKSAVNDLRDKFATDMRKKSEARHQFESDFKNSVNDRIEGREERLEAELQKQKLKSVNAEVVADRKAENEINNVKRTYQDKFDYLEKARRDTLNMANDVNADNVKKIRSEADKMMAQTNRRTMMNADAEVLRHRQALEQNQSDFELRSEFQQAATQDRVDKIRSESMTGEKRLRENFNANVEVLKEGHQNESRDQRLALEKDKNSALMNMKVQLQKVEGEGQQKLSDLTTKYEKRIAELNDQFVREKRIRDNREKQLVAELKRAHEAQVEAVRVKYEEQNRQTQMKHEKEMKDVTRRNNERIDNIVSVSKKA